MIHRDYEQYQLQLIAAEYRSKGYTVELESRVPESNSTFDAIARGPEGTLVIVELVNAERPVESRGERLEVLRRAATLFPNAAVDLRYIDSKNSAFAFQIQGGGQVAQDSDPLEHLNSLLKARLPQHSGASAISLVRQYLSLWAIHVATIRAFAMVALSDPDRTLNVLDQYDALLKEGLLVAPEQFEDSAQLDQYELHQLAEALLQGAPTKVGQVIELRTHLRSVRAQIRLWKRTTPKAVLKRLRGDPKRSI